MKKSATITFNLENKIDKEDYFNAMRATELSDFIDQFHDSFLRKLNQAKHGDGIDVIVTKTGTYVNIKYAIDKYFQMQSDIIGQ